MPHNEREALEIKLESSELVLRGFTGDEFEPAVLRGELLVNLTEDTNLREISLTFSGSAKVVWRDSSSHHHEHPLFFHDFCFLNPSSSSAPHATGKGHAHTHTLPAGRHVFPFTLHVPGTLPSTLRTYSGSGVIEYKLKALVTRPGLASDWKAKKTVRVTRGFGPDAVEYNQTLEIENTWPGKVMYAFTMPHKAYAAGDSIPVSVKFSPISKGIKIVQLISSIRESTMVQAKASSHSEARDATTVKYSFVENASGANSPVPPQPARIDSSASLTSLVNSSGATTPALQEVNRRESVTANATPGGSGEAAEEEEDDGIDAEIDAVVEVPIPVWTTPTHTVQPVLVSHKIKWSAFIRNPDGHISELRCALPIHVLSPTLAEEVRLATTGTRTLLFGESGVLTRSDVPQADLPSYQDHVMDRLANVDTSSVNPTPGGFTPTPWSTRTSPLPTPLQSPTHSRPPSPTGRHPGSAPPGLVTQLSSGAQTPALPASPMADHRNWIDSELLSSLNLDRQHTSPSGSLPNSRPGSAPGSRAPSRPPSRPPSPPPGFRDRSDASPTGAMTPASGLQSRDEPPPLLRAHTAGSGFFNLHLPKPLRPLSNFSRNGSHTSLRDLNHGHGADSPQSMNSQPSASALSHALMAHAARSASASRRTSVDMYHHHALSNSPYPAGASSSTSPLSSSPSTNPANSSSQPSFFNLAPTGSSGTMSPSPLNASASYSVPTTPGFQHANTPPLEAARHHVLSDEELETIDLLSQVPSYDVARRGFLGGGVVPLNNLPNYEDVARAASPARSPSSPVRVAATGHSSS